MPQDKNRITVLCINDGIIYPSMLDAAKQYGISQSAISRQINGKRKTAKGYYFVIVPHDITKHDIKLLQKEYIKKILTTGDDAHGN